MPPGTVYVGRPTRWGNPFTSADAGSPDAAVAAYRTHLTATPGLLDAARRQLAGRDLACWCPTGRPCHADVLLDLVNDPIGDPMSRTIDQRRDVDQRRRDALRQILDLADEHNLRLPKTIRMDEFSGDETGPAWAALQMDLDDERSDDVARWADALGVNERSRDDVGHDTKRWINDNAARWDRDPATDWLLVSVQSQCDVQAVVTPVAEVA